MGIIERIIYYLGILTVSITSVVNPSGMQVMGVQASPTPTSITIPTSTPSATLTPSKTPTRRPTTTPDPDPYIQCRFSPECGGEIKQLRTSVCKNTTCCEIAGKWTPYLDRGKCLEDQQRHSDEQSKQAYEDIIRQINDLPTYPTSMPYVAPTKDPQKIKDCKDQAMSWYQKDARDCNNSGDGLTGSARQQVVESCLIRVYSERDRRLSNCE